MAGVKKAGGSIAGKELALRLFKDPRKVNWDVFANALKRDGARYYAVVFPASLGGKQDLLKAYAILYGKGRRPLYKVPIVIRNGKSIEGAMAMFADLELNRAVGR